MVQTRSLFLLRRYVSWLYELLDGGIIYELDHIPGFGGQEGLDQLPDGGKDPGHVVHHDLGYKVRVVVHHGVDQELYGLYFHISEKVVTMAGRGCDKFIQLGHGLKSRAVLPNCNYCNLNLIYNLNLIELKLWARHE